LLDIQIIEVDEAGDGFTRHQFEESGEKCFFSTGPIFVQSQEQNSLLWLVGAEIPRWIRNGDGVECLSKFYGIETSQIDAMCTMLIMIGFEDDGSHGLKCGRKCYNTESRYDRAVVSME